MDAWCSPLEVKITSSLLMVRGRTQHAGRSSQVGWRALDQVTKWTRLSNNSTALAQDKVNKTASRTNQPAPRVAKMRLRLSVQRNNLPVSNILWSVPDTASAQAYTFARLLEDVNQILPLEAEQWGLEDYIVELEGFE